MTSELPQNINTESQKRLKTSARQRNLVGLELAAVALTAGGVYLLTGHGRRGGFCGEEGIISIEQKSIYTVESDRPWMTDNGVRSLFMDRDGLFLGFAGQHQDNVSFLTPEGWGVCGPRISGHTNGITKNPTTDELFIATDGDKQSSRNGVYIRRHGSFLRRGEWLHFYKEEIVGGRNELRGLARAETYAAVPDVGKDAHATLVGTLDGVSRWDNRKWFPVPELRMPNPATNQRIHALLPIEMADGHKRTYVGMVMEGLGLVDQGKPAILYRAELTEPGTILSNSIRAIVLSPDKQTVAVANGPYVSFHELLGDRWYAVRVFEPEQGVLGLAYDHLGRLIATGDGGAKILERGSWRVINGIPPAYSVAVGQKGYAYGEGTYFVGTKQDGLYQAKLPLPLNPNQA